MHKFFCFFSHPRECGDPLQSTCAVAFFCFDNYRGVCYAAWIPAFARMTEKKHRYLNVNVLVNFLTSNSRYLVILPKAGGSLHNDLNSCFSDFDNHLGLCMFCRIFQSSWRMAIDTNFLLKIKS